MTVLPASVISRRVSGVRPLRASTSDTSAQTCARIRCESSFKPSGCSSVYWMRLMTSAP